MKSRARSYLLSQKSGSWSWNYNERGTKTSRGSSLPDDLDDTACALAALSMTSATDIGPEALANFVKHLVLCEEKEGGPYHTWIMPKEKRPAWRDIDVVVNANISFFLSMHGVRLAPLEAFIDSSIESGKPRSLYYRSPVSIAYFISRLSGTISRRKKLADIVLAGRKRNGLWNTSLETAQALSTLIRLGENPSYLEPIAEALWSQADANGLWKAAPFYVEEVRGKKIHYAGSVSLTTAFCIEALSLFESRKQSRTEKTARAHDQSRADSLAQQSFLSAAKIVRECGEPIASQAGAALNRIKDKGALRAIAGLPTDFYDALRHPPKIGKGTLARLGAANLLGWAGYTLQDNILDGDSDGRLLPASNAIIRRSFCMLKDAAPDQSGKTFIWSVFERIDRANAWEAGAASLERSGDSFSLPSDPPDYRSFSALADKSLGHALGPLILVMLSKNDPASTPFRKALSFFEHYIIARQINDDAHDWSDDLKKGRVNSVSARLIKAHIRTDGFKRSGRLSSGSALPSLRELFWNTEILTTAEYIFKHARLARTALRSSGLMKNNDFAESLLLPLETAAQKALEERARAIDFIRAYS